jgi:hypothetical protein
MSREGEIGQVVVARLRIWGCGFVGFWGAKKMKSNLVELGRIHSNAGCGLNRELVSWALAN